MKRFFKVADLVFCVDGPADFKAQMTQYEPFETCPQEDVCFCLDVTCEMDIPELETVYDQPTDPGETKVAIFRNADTLYVRSAPLDTVPWVGTLRVDNPYDRFTLAVHSKTQKGQTFALNNALMLSFAFATATLGVLEMHASVTVCDDKAYLFVAKSGTGKSTHSRMWLENISGTHLLNDDNPVVRVFPDGRIICYGSPWSGKTPCYRNLSYPCGAVVKIVRDTENYAVRFSAPEAYATVYSSSSGFKSDETIADGLYGSISRIALNLPCYAMHCRPDAQAAIVCHDTVCSNK